MGKISTKLQLTTLNGSKSVTKSLTFANSEKDNATLADSARMINSLSNNTLKSIVRVDRQNITDAEEAPSFEGFTFSLTNPVFGTNGFGGKGLDLIAMKLCNYASDTTINSITPDGDNFIINYTKADETTSTVSLASTTSTLIITAESENGSRTFEGPFAEFYDIYTATNRFQAFCDWFNAKAETKNSPIRMTWEPNKNTVSFINTNAEGGAKKRKISIMITSSKFQYVDDLIEAAYDTAPTDVQFISSNILIEVTEP